jgi:hypothetical protein
MGFTQCLLNPELFTECGIKYSVKFCCRSKSQALPNTPQCHLQYLKSCEKSQKELETENLGFTAIDVALWEKKNAEEEEEDEGSTESGKAAAHFMKLSPPRWQPATWQRSRRFYLRFSFSFHVARHYRMNSQSYKATVHMSLTNWDSSPVSSPTQLCHPPW